MRSKVANCFLFFVVAVCSSSLAHAGRYVITYDLTPCKVEMQGPFAAPWWLPYSVDTSGVSGQGVGTDPIHGGTSAGGPGWVHCTGAITVRFTWNNEGDPTSRPPKSIVIREAAAATWSGDTGSCDNGLNDPEVNKTSQGTHYTVKNDPPETFSFVRTPHAEAASPGPEGSTASVRYKADVLPLELILEGTIEYGSRSKTVVGRLIVGGIQIGDDPTQQEITTAGEYWTAEGDTFEKYMVSAGADTGYVIPFNNHYQSTWCWKDGGENLTVTCTFGLYVNNVLIGAASLERQVDVARPRYEMGAESEGKVHYTGGIFSNKVKAGTPEKAGITFTSRIENPEPFTSLDGWKIAQGAYVQLCNLDHYTLCQVNANIFHFKLKTNGFVLDNSFPYAGPFVAFWRDDNIRAGEMPATDSPDWPLSPPSISYRANAQFRMYLMFRPDGDLRYYVPLAELSWVWEAKGFRPSMSHWPEPIEGSVQLGSSQDTKDHPVWTEKYTNGDVYPIPGP